jgi:thioredoxin-like negative regulator of GroEL
MEILIRLGIAAFICGLSFAEYWMWTRLRLNRLQGRASKLESTGLDEFRKGTPAILYFTTPDCAPCTIVQGPAIETLGSEYGEALQIIQIDASQRVDLADYWGVLSVPTTFIIDARGEPRHINNGVVSATKLRQQLSEFAGLGDPSNHHTQVGLSPATVGR